MIENRLRELRLEKGLTIKEVVKMSEIDVTKSHLGGIERHDSSMSIPILIKLSKFYDVSIDYILKLSNYKR